MAKEKRSAADLDAELAALEAELAALEGKAKKASKAPKAETKPAPASPVAPAPASEAPAAPAEKKGRFALPKLGKKEKPAETTPTPEPMSVPTPAAAPAAPAHAPAPASYDASVWRQEGDAWVRALPETPVPVVRRVLDENGNVVREEPADTRVVEDVSSVKAERGLGRLLRRK